MGEMTARHAPLVAVKTAVARQRESLAALATLNESIAWWVGRRRAKGVSDEQSHRELYLRFNTNIFDAQCLSVTEALNLAEKLDNA